ncbi:MAG: phytanoyl-CoA dioxygenase family protein [Chitinophagales bacterium]
MPDTGGQKMQQLFKNKNLQADFERYGYVVVPFLSEKEVAELKDFFHETHPEIPNGFYSSSFNEDSKHKEKINQKVESLLGNKVESKFTEVKKLGSCFLNKQPGPESEMPIHQDWTVVDENRFASVTIWIPLQDVGEKNGAIQVIDGSHKFSDALRSPSLTDPFNNIRDVIRKDLKLLPMKAGEAFIFNQALLHASPPNFSESPRLAVTYGLIHADADLRFYHGAEDGKVEQYAVGTNFFQEYNTQIGERPKNGKLIDTFKYDRKPLTLEAYRTKKIAFMQEERAENFKMKPLFKDVEKQQFFENEGYAVFPLIDQNEVDDLKRYYENLNLKDENGFGFHVSMDQKDKDMCRSIREKIWGAVVPALENHLKDFKPYVSSFVIKESNPKGVVPAHQDWSFVDKEEDGYCSITCWVALVDTTLDNGCMGVIKGSHRFMEYNRPSPSPQTPVPLSDHMFSIFPYLKTIEMKAGEVLMFDNRTFHASPPNTTDGIRLAAGVGVTQKDAQLVHYYLKPDGKNDTLLKYKVDEDFFLKYENARLAKMYENGELIEGYGEPKEVPYDCPQFTSDELVEMIKSAGNEYNVPMTEKLAKLFSQQEKQQEQKEEEEKTVEHEEKPKEQEEYVWIDDRSFFQKYTPLNIAREIKKKLVS